MYKYRWTVERVDGYPQRDNLDNVVAIVFWELEVRDTTDHSIHYIRAQTELPPPNSESFLDYLELDQTNILNWVWQIVDKEKMELQAKTELDELREPFTRLQSLPMPWLAGCCPEGMGVDYGKSLQFDQAPPPP